MHRKLLILGSLMGLLAVIIGAFGAHGLKNMLTASDLDTFEVGVRYQFYHALLAVILGSVNFLSKKSANSVFYLLLIGVIFFSGSIYGLATNQFSFFDFKHIAWLTPIGGVLLISVWLILTVKALKMKRK